MELLILVILIVICCAELISNIVSILFLWLKDVLAMDIQVEGWWLKSSMIRFLYQLAADNAWTLILLWQRHLEYIVEFKQQKISTRLM